MGIVDRATIRWPGMSARGQVVSAGIPTTAARGGAIAAAIDLADATVIDKINTADETYQRLVIPQSGARGDVQAISIAPDSAIYECDIALLGEDGEQKRHRVSPGNPLVADFRSVDYALVSIPDSFPLFIATNEDAVIDGETVIEDSGLGGAIVGFPLRLEMWRAGGMPVREFRRAPMVGHVLIDTDLVGVSGPAFARQIAICTNGRRRLRVSFFGAGLGVSTIAMSILSVFPYKTASQRTDGNTSTTYPLNSAGDVSVNLTNGVAIYEIESLQSSMTVISLSAGAAIANGQLQVRVRAED